jgi:hypothetical protein
MPSKGFTGSGPIHSGSYGLADLVTVTRVVAGEVLDLRDGWAGRWSAAWRVSGSEVVCPVRDASSPPRPSGRASPRASTSWHPASSKASSQPGTQPGTGAGTTCGTSTSPARQNRTTPPLRRSSTPTRRASPQRSTARQATCFNVSVTEFLSWPLGIDSWPPVPQPLRRRSAIVRDARRLAASEGAGGVERAGISLDESKNLLLNVVFRM